MRWFFVVSISILLLAVTQLGVDGQEAGTQPASNPGRQSLPKAAPAAKPPAKPPVKEPATKNPADKTATAQESSTVSNSVEQSPDEKAIRQTAEIYVKDFNEHNPTAVGEQYTAEAEYVDESGRLFHGRAAIVELLAQFFAEFPTSQVELKIETIRFIGSGVAVEDGMTRITRSKDLDPVIARYTAVHTKSSGKWLVASVRDFSVKTARQHRNQLKQLDWMLGDWVHEGSDAVVTFSCKPVDNDNFLLRTFAIKIGGEQLMSGSQRIGWDASSHKFRTWTFDSDGGHSEGYWHRDGDSWVLKSAGVTADGHVASNTSIYTFVNAHTMTFQSTDHEVSGVELPDGPKVTIVRHAPQPE